VIEPRTPYLESLCEYLKRSIRFSIPRSEEALVARHERLHKGKEKQADLMDELAEEVDEVHLKEGEGEPTKKKNQKQGVSDGNLVSDAHGRQ
jgi:hypothetical protein